jgi:hypothetical protein
MVDGVLWREVESFTDSQPRREYRVEFDSAYRSFIIFGNNRAGMIPSVSSRIDVTYRQGGGTVGNIVTGYVQTQTQVVVPGFGFSIPVLVRNYTKGQYGYAGDTIEDIRRKLPLYLRTQDRCVSGEDYKILADQLVTPYHGQIGKSIVTLRNHGCAGNIIDIYVLALNGKNDLEEASNELKVDLNNAISTKKMLTDFICIKDGVIVYVDVAIDLTIDKFYRKFENEIKTNVENKISNLFNLHNWEFGQSLRHTDIIKILSDMPEIRQSDVNLISMDPQNSGLQVNTKFYEIIRSDTITISFNYT